MSHDEMGVLVAALAPVVGWVVTVEKRLAKLTSMDQKLDGLDAKVDQKTDQIIGYLLHARHDAVGERPEAGRGEEKLPV